MPGGTGEPRRRQAADPLKSHRRAGSGSLGPLSLEGQAMIQITPQMRILVAVAAVDLRRGIDGLARVCQEVLAADPFSGCLFVFRNRRATSLKILVYDSQGFWLCQKRLSRGRFRFLPAGPRGACQRLA